VTGNWFERWILVPLLASPAIIVDPFTFYGCVLGDDGPEPSTGDDDDPAELAESSE